MIGVPIPAKFEINTETVSKAVEEAFEALKETPTKGAEGGAVLFKKTCEILGEPAKNALISLLKYNAKIGSKLALSF